HSLVVDPMGVIVADAGSEPGLAIADIDPSAVERARNMLGSLTHDRPFELADWRDRSREPARTAA
ncbi:MAG: carbon-nitrogen hydrolase family protein, partial [Gemmatimonadaceae bacterium]